MGNLELIELFLKLLLMKRMGSLRTARFLKYQ